MATFRELVKRLAQGLVGKVTLRLPGVDFEISSDEVRSLVEDKGSVRLVLTRCLIQRRIYWERVEREGRTFVKDSAAEAVEFLRTEFEHYRDARGSKVAISRILLQVETAAIELRQSMEGTQDFDRSRIEEAIFKFRKQSLPLFGALSETLDQDDPIRLAAEERISESMSTMPGRDRMAIVDAWRVAP